MTEIAQFVWYVLVLRSRPLVCDHHQRTLRQGLAERERTHHRDQKGQRLLQFGQ